ncbi:hypothetical protein FKM82_003464 [Ascaphus truei]
MQHPLGGTLASHPVLSATHAASAQVTVGERPLLHCHSAVASLHTARKSHISKPPTVRPQQILIIFSPPPPSIVVYCSSQLSDLQFPKVKKPEIDCSI